MKKGNDFSGPFWALETTIFLVKTHNLSKYGTLKSNRIQPISKIECRTEFSEIRKLQKGNMKK